jgi:hypothetical protein
MWQLGCGNWDVATGMWQLGCGNWDVATGMWQLGCGNWDVLATRMWEHLLYVNLLLDTGMWLFT